MITIILTLATVMQTLDTTIVNVALPHMEGSLGATQDQISWVLTSYIVAAAIMTPTTGWLAARFGRTWLFVVSLIGFTVTSLLCGIAGTIGQMVFFRILQGIFGAALMPLSQAILLDTFPRDQIGRAMSFWGMGVMVGPILGPTLGGYLTDQFDWRWCFYINLPIGILTVLGALAFIHESARSREWRFDWLGFSFLTMAIAAVQLALDRGEARGWFQSAEIKIEAVLALFGLYMFIVHSLTAQRPFVNLALFSDRNFVLSLFLMMSVGIVMNGSTILLPQLLQTEFGYPVITTGLLMGPRGFGTMTAMFLYGRIANRIDPRWAIVVGMGMIGGSMYLMSGWSLGVGAHQIVGTGVIQGFGMGLTFSPVTALAFSTLPTDIRTEGSGFYSLIRNLGGAVGISIVVSQLSELTQTNHAHLGTFFTPFHAPLGRPGVSDMTAMAMLNLDITRQAGMVAYINVYRLMAVLSVVFLPLLLLVRTGRARTEAPDSAAAAMH